MGWGHCLDLLFHLYFVIKYGHVAYFVSFFFNLILTQKVRAEHQMCGPG